MGSNPAPCSRANSLIERSDVNTLPACDSRSLATGSSGFGCIVTSPFCGPVDSVGRTFTSHTHNVRLQGWATGDRPRAHRVAVAVWIILYTSTIDHGSA